MHLKFIGHKLKNNHNLFYLKGSKHRVKFPPLNKELALFLGILSGDGWIISRNKAILNSQWRIGLVEDDKLLINYYLLLCKKLFNVYPKTFDRKTKIEAFINSRIIYENIIQNFNFPDGEKINRLRIPKQILKSRGMLKCFLKGIFSTDGKIDLYHSYPRIGVDSATVNFTKDIDIVMKKLGFNSKIYIYNRKKGNRLYSLRINGFEQVLKFYNEIGFIGEKEKRLQKLINQNKSIAPSSRLAIS